MSMFGAMRCWLVPIWWSPERLATRLWVPEPIGLEWHCWIGCPAANEPHFFGPRAL